MAKKKKYKNAVDSVIIEKEAVDVKKKPLLEVILSKSKYQYLLLFLLVFMLYGNTLTLQFALDDRLLITENAFTKKGFAGIKDILTNDSFVGFFGEKKNLLTGGRYRPLSQVIFAMEFEFFGLNPFIGHLINILLYSLTCMVLLMVLKRLFASYRGLLRYLPYLATLFYMAHPLHTEVVANIKGSDDILSFLLSISTLFFIIKFFDKRQAYLLIIAAALFFLAFTAKENAITFLGVIPLCLYFFFKPKIKDYFLTILPLGIVAVLFIYIRFAVLGFQLNIGVEKELLNNPFIGTGTADKFATIFYTMGVYIKLLFFPYQLTHDYYPFHIEIVKWTSFKAILPLLIYFMLAVYAVWGCLKKQLPAFGVAIYLMTFSISSNIVFNIGTFMNERFMFVPSLGFCIILAYLLITWLTKMKGNQQKIGSYIGIVTLIIMMLYSIRTFSRNFVWKNDFTLFTTDVNVSENSAKCNVSAGGVLIEESQKTKDPVQKEEFLNRALKYLEHGVKIHPHYVAAWVLYGNAYLYLEKFKETFVCYENALNIAPKNKDALNNMAHLAQLLDSKGFYDFSITVFNKLNNYEPLSHDNRYQLARVYENKNKIDSAMTILFAIVKEDSMYFNAHSKLGELYGKVYNNIDKSLEHLLIAYKIKPGDASNLENIGIAYGIKKDFANSLHFFEEAMKINPDKPELYMNVSQTYDIMGNKAKGEEYKRKAQEVASKKK